MSFNPNHRCIASILFEYLEYKAVNSLQTKHWTFKGRPEELGRRFDADGLQTKPMIDIFQAHVIIMIGSNDALFERRLSVLEQPEAGEPIEENRKS